jgi:hypothetical protein
MFNLENPYKKSESRDPEGYPQLSNALEMSDDIFEDAIPYDIFIKTSNPDSGPYDKERIERDQAYVTKLKQKFEDANKSKMKQSFGWETHQKVGKVFEAMVLDGIDMNAWFGENAQVIIPTAFDDIVNGVDGVVEFEDEKNFVAHLALGFDVATSIEGINKKLERTKQNIDAGHLTKMDYFYSEAQDFKGQKSNIPRVILIADRKTIRDIMDLWVERKNKTLATHHIQIQLLEESLLQLQSFQKYAEVIGKDKLVDIYKKNIELLSTILNDKKELIGKKQYQKLMEEVQKDIGYQSLQRNINKLFNE